MFTGLIQRTGRVVVIETVESGGSLTAQVGDWEPPLAAGESVAVQGACLTVADASGAGARFDVLHETFERTNLKEARSGDILNLERALRLGDPMGGHMVTGHVDGTGRVRGIRRAGRDWILEVACGEELLGDMASKGSIACDGVSLTIADLGAGFFSVHIIPHTWSHTSLSRLTVGDAVNLETDILAKYVRRVARGGGGEGGVTWDSLSKSGFMR